MDDSDEHGGDASDAGEDAIRNAGQNAGQNAGARPGGQAQGGIEPRPGDPLTPEDVARRDDADRRTMRDAGFGDHKGSNID